MGKYTKDGGVVSNKVPIGARSDREHQMKFGIYRGQVLKTIYPGDKENSNGGRIEYAVRVGGQTFPNAVRIGDGGGIYNYKETILKHAEKSFDKSIEEGTYSENLDGEFVYVMFIEGNQNLPVIVGSSTHPRKAAYKKLKPEDGFIDIEEYNGVEFSVDKDSNYTVKHVGRKDKEGKVVNEAAVDAFMKLFGNGDMEFNTHGTEGTADLRMKFNKETKKFEVYAQDNKIILDENGIIVEDKFTNKIEMKDGQVNITVAGDANINVDGNTTINSKDTTVNVDGAATINATGDATISADGNAKFEGTGGTTVGSAGSITQVQGNQVNLAGGGPPVARLGDMVVGTGNLGAPVVSQILQGSPKVKSG